MSLRTSHSARPDGIRLQLGPRRLRARNLQGHQADHKIKLPRLRFEPRNAATEVTSDWRAHAAFTEHLNLQGSTNTIEVATRLLKQAAACRDVPPYLVLGAALLVEQQCHSHTDTLAMLHGRWQMVFASTNGTALLWYLPVKEYKDVDTKNNTCNLVTYLGPLMTSFSGSYSVLSGQKMQFKFTKLVIAAFSRTLVERPVSLTEKQYTYYWMQGNLACARSSGGGVVLLRRTEPLHV